MFSSYITTQRVYSFLGNIYLTYIRIVYTIMCFKYLCEVKFNVHVFFMTRLFVDQV